MQTCEAAIASVDLHGQAQHAIPFSSTCTDCCTGAKYTFTIKEGADGKNGRISVNYDGFIDDVGVNDMLLVDGGMLSLKILEKTKQDVVCEVVDGGSMGSRYHYLVARWNSASANVKT